MNGAPGLVEVIEIPFNFAQGRLRLRARKANPHASLRMTVMRGRRQLTSTAGPSTPRNIVSRCSASSREDLNIPTQAKGGLEWGTRPRGTDRDPSTTHAGSKSESACFAQDDNCAGLTSVDVTTAGPSTPQIIVSRCSATVGRRSAHPPTQAKGGLEWATVRKFKVKITSDPDLVVGLFKADSGLSGAVQPLDEAFPLLVRVFAPSILTRSLPVPHSPVA